MMLLKINQFVIKREGVAAIEFSMAFFGFFIMVMFVAEIVRLAYISSAVDLAVSESAKEAKNAQLQSASNYETRFRSRMTNEGGRLWRFLANSQSVQVQVQFANSVTDLLNDNYSAVSDNRPLARYQVAYDYKPMFFPFPGMWAKTLLKREVIFVQEYERSEFVD